MKINEYLKETKAEFKQVKWPTRKDTMLYTGIVVFASVAVAYLLGLFDFGFTQGLSKLLQ